MELTKEDMSKIFWETFEQMTQEALEKAAKDKGKEVLKVSEDVMPKSFFVNPYDFTASTGMWRERRSRISWETLRVIADRNPIISAIINTRVNQVGTFSSPASMLEASGNNALGFKMVHRDRDHKLTPGEQDFITGLERYIWACGSTDRQSIYDRDNFDGWLRKMVRDSLTFDAGTTELVPTRKGSIAEFHAIDAGTVRIAVVREDVDEKEDRAFVQVVDGRIVAEYSPHEILYGVRNPVTNIRGNGYGISEIEQLISVVTNILNAMTHNAMFFKNGAAVKGIVNIKAGSAPPEQVEAFKRAWQVMVSGAANAWKTPILQSDGVDFVNMGNTNREMEFQKYLDFLVKITCAVFAIDPAEINFYLSGGTGGGAPMFEGNQEAKLKMSKDKGLRPLISAVSRWINQFIIRPITDDFYFAFTGIDSKDEKEIINLRKEEVASYKTLDEIRAEAGLPPRGKENGGDLILNPQYLQYLQQKSMAGMMGGGGEAEEQGEPGAEENEPGAEEQEQEKNEQEKAGSEEEERESLGEGEEVKKSFQTPAKYIRFSLED